MRQHAVTCQPAGILAPRFDCVDARRSEHALCCPRSHEARHAFGASSRRDRRPATRSRRRRHPRIRDDRAWRRHDRHRRHAAGGHHHAAPGRLDSRGRHLRTRRRERSMTFVIRNIAIAAFVAAIGAPAIAQKTITRSGETITATATVQQIDLARRYVVLRGDDGAEIGVFAPPEFVRLNEIRVGDAVTITYYESIVYRIHRPGTPRPPVSEEVTAVESKSALPGATFSHQVTERV